MNRFERDVEINMMEKMKKVKLTKNEEDMIAAFGGATWEIGHDLGKCDMTLEELSDECIKVGLMWKLANYPYEEMDNFEFGDFVCVYNRVKWEDASGEDLEYYKKQLMIELLDLDDFPQIKNMKADKIAKLYCSENFNYLDNLEGLAVLKRIVKANDEDFKVMEAIIREYKGV